MLLSNVVLRATEDALLRATEPVDLTDTDIELARIQTDALFEQLPQGLAVTLINAAALTYVQSSAVPAENAMMWLLAIGIVSMLRGGLCVAYRIYGKDGRQNHRWRSAFLLGVFASSMLWGATSIVLFPSDSFAHQALIGFVLAGMSSGAVASFITSHKAFLVFIIPACTPYALRLLEQGAPMQIAMGLMCLAFTGAMYLTSKKTSAMALEALRLRFKNEDLVRLLQDEIAERKQQQAGLQRLMGQVHEAAQAKSQFLANMSHEIRTPLNGVIGMSDVLSRSQLTMRQRHQLTLIQKSARTLLSLLNGILDFSRIEAGRIELETAVFDLRELVADAVDILADQAQSKGLELAYVIANDVPAMITGDQMRIRQVLVNLVSNAVKFTDSGSVVLRVNTAGEPKGPAIHFSVTDTGIGIKPEFQEHLFDPFKQADASVTRRFGGTGLGLSISHHLVALMGGTLSCRSALGQGSEFYFDLPLPKAPCQTSRYAKLALPGSCRVLAADENEVTREILTNYLESWKLDITTCDSGGRMIATLANAAIAGKPFDIAIVSTSLPDISGLELVARISSIPAIKSTRVILATPLNWSDDVRASKLSNRVCTITKPIRQSQLFERLAALTVSTGSDTAGNGNLHEPAGEQARTFAAHILLVEDNPVNQELAVEYLRAFDCTFDIASNGKQAIEASGKKAYDLILMDCQMPELDGYAATRLIRQRETDAKAERTPIIALTAGAFSGDREQCLKAGMDGYLSKPFSQQALEHELTKWLAPSPTAAASPQAVQPADTAAITSPRDPLDRKHIAGMRERKSGLLLRLIDIYLEHAPLLLDKLQKAQDEGDLSSVKELAHSLKSSSGNIAAPGLTELCQLLEVQAMKGEFDRARATVEAIVKEYGDVSSALAGEGEALKARANG